MNVQVPDLNQESLHSSGAKRIEESCRGAQGRIVDPSLQDVYENMGKLLPSIETTEAPNTSLFEVPSYGQFQVPIVKFKDKNLNS